MINTYRHVSVWSIDWKARWETLTHNLLLTAEVWLNKDTDNKEGKLWGGCDEPTITLRWKREGLPDMSRNS